MKDRKFKSYNTMCERFRNLGIKRSGKLTTFLLKTFVLGDGKIYSDRAHEADLLEPNEIFKVWRTKMCSLNILSYEFNKTNPKESKYSPGYRIIDLINKEILLRGKVATEKFVENKIDDLERRLKMNSDGVKYLIEKYDPPCTEEKYNKIINSKEQPTIEPDFDFGE